MKGILLAAGKGTRLRPSTSAISKHLLNVYDKPLIYYSLSSLMLAGIRKIALISTSRDLPLYKSIFGNGERLGIEITYIVQDDALGIPDAYIKASEFLSGSSSVLALGDNIFHGTGFSHTLKELSDLKTGAAILLKKVPDPNRFGIAELDAGGYPVRLVEKPANANSDFAITGLYALDGRSSDLARGLAPSNRGELEMVDLLDVYLKDKTLTSSQVPRGTMWLDTGTVESMLDAAVFIRAFQDHTGNLIGSPEEAAYRNGWIDSAELEKAARQHVNRYGEYLRGILA